MALKKPCEVVETGAIGEYLKIQSCLVEKGRLTIKVWLYKDNAARIANKSPMAEFEKIYPASVSELEKLNPFALGYKKLKEAEDFWATAEDL